jgi:hypothetical protein
MSVQSLIITGAAGLVALLVWATLVEMISKLRAWRDLHTRGPADLSYSILQHSTHKVETVDTLHHGRITCIGRWVHQRTYSTRAFHIRNAHKQFETHI